MSVGTGTATAAPLASWLGPARFGFLSGALLSLLGFALPWFRVSRSYSWWYGGWDMVTTNEPGLWWISFLFLGYAILVVGGYWLIGAGAGEAGMLAALAIATALGTLVVVALAAGDAIQAQGRVYSIDLNLGLFVMLPGHGVMIAAAFFGIVLHLIAEFVSPPAPGPVAAPLDMPGSPGE
jgi:hypothetical protein